MSKHLERELIGIASWIRTSLIVSDKNFLGQYAQLLEIDPECDIRMDFDTNEYPNIFVSRK